MGASSANWCYEMTIMHWALMNWPIELTGYLLAHDRILVQRRAKDGYESLVHRKNELGYTPLESNVVCASALSFWPARMDTLFAEIDLLIAAGARVDWHLLYQTIFGCACASSWFYAVKVLQYVLNAAPPGPIDDNESHFYGKAESVMNWAEGVKSEISHVKKEMVFLSRAASLRR